MTKHNLPLKDRFWPKVNKRGPDECWEWTASTIAGGYGHMGVNGKIVLAHRVSYELHNGPIPSGDGYHGTCVLHKCDNPKCVNPKHLFLGSNADNMADRELKGRGATPDNRGDSHGMAKLSEEDVLEIRSLLKTGGMLQKCIAETFGVSSAQISAINTGRSWGHI